MNKNWKIIDTEMQSILDKLRIEAPNTGHVLEFNIDGYWEIYDPYDRKTIKKYKTLKKAIDFLLNTN